MARNLDHLVITIPPEASQFTSTQQGGPEVRLPPRVRNVHGSALQQKLANAWKEAEKEVIIAHVSTREGAYLEFKGEENYELAVKSLEDLKSKQIRLLNVREKDNTEYATVFVANSKKEFFFDKIESYIKKDRVDTGKPHNQKLIESISEIRKALAIESFWMDSTDLIPKDAPEWCEIWLRDSGNGVLGNFEMLLTSLNIQFKNGALIFPEENC